MKAYKLTDEFSKTRNNTLWEIGKTVCATGKETELCSDGWIHFYTNPLIAVLINPIHANFKNPILYECETSGEELHEALKSGCKSLTITKRIDIPTISTVQKVAFGILCAKQITTNEDWILWADNWLSGLDRTKAAAYAAYDAYDAASAAYAAAYDAAVAADAKKNINFIELANKAMTYK